MKDEDEFGAKGYINGEIDNREEGIGFEDSHIENIVHLFNYEEMVYVLDYTDSGKETIEDYPLEDKEIVEEMYQSSTFTIELVE